MILVYETRGITYISDVISKYGASISVSSLSYAPSPNEGVYKKKNIDAKGMVYNMVLVRRENVHIHVISAKTT